MMNTTFYLENATFLIAVDCIIFGFKDKELHILLTRRPMEPLKGEWSLMGDLGKKMRVCRSCGEDSLSIY